MVLDRKMLQWLPLFMLVFLLDWIMKVNSLDSDGARDFGLRGGGVKELLLGAAS